MAWQREVLLERVHDLGDGLVKEDSKGKGA